MSRPSFTFLLGFVRPESQGPVTDRNVSEHALLGAMHGSIERERALAGGGGLTFI